tara:strand:+ start:171 stop:1034 length:864 start_codon:yes stop_codon:yes gene_type:complete
MVKMKKLIFLFFLILLSSPIYSLSITSVESFPSKIEPGNTANILLQIKNEENFDIERVTIKLDLSNPLLPIAPRGAGTEKFITEIGDEDEEYVYFDIVVLSYASLGIYRIPLLITYEVSEEIITKSEVISLEVYSPPDLDVKISNPDFLLAQVFEVEFEITNKGLSGVTSLNLKLEDSPFYDVISSQDIYVGKIDSDDFERVDFKVIMNYPIPNEVPFSINLEYYDSSNIKHTGDFKIKKRAYSLSEAKSLGLVEESRGSYTYIGFFVLIVLFLIYKRFKKKRKRLI